MRPGCSRSPRTVRIPGFQFRGIGSFVSSKGAIQILFLRANSYSVERFLWPSLISGQAIQGAQHLGFVSQERDSVTFLRRPFRRRPFFFSRSVLGSTRILGRMLRGGSPYTFYQICRRLPIAGIFPLSPKFIPDFGYWYPQAKFTLPPYSALGGTFAT